MIDHVLEGLLPTRQRPRGDLDTVGDRSVVLDRGIAGGIDLLVCYVLVEMPVLYVVGELLPSAFEVLGGAALVLSVVLLLPVYVTYSFAFEWRYGRTPGKVNRGLVVTMEDGRDCHFGAAAVRNILRYVDLIGVPPVIVGLVCALVTDGRRVGDLLADTVVVRTRLTDEERGRTAVGATSADRADDGRSGR